MGIPVKNTLFLLLGAVFTIIGVIGIFVPVMPTVPFLLVAAFFFVRSSRRAYDWLANHPVLGIYVKDYLESGGVSRRMKIIGLAALWASVIFSSLVFLSSWIYRAIFVFCALAATVYVLSLRTIGRDEPGGEDPRR